MMIFLKYIKFILMLVILSGLIIAPSSISNETTTLNDQTTNRGELSFQALNYLLIVLTADQSHSKLNDRPLVVHQGKLTTNENKAQIILQGKTLDIYEYLMENPGYHGVREMQRIMEYSSPNLAFYHLSKLVSMGIVIKDHKNQYSLNEIGEKFGSFTQKIGIYGKWIRTNLILAFLQLLAFILGITGIIIGYSEIALIIISSILLTQFFYFFKRSRD